jgi:hypothetical protein|tara:strand:- start:424 stop:669 length:246 start_codon:yes stop_codon:yes gene_type:complete
MMDDSLLRAGARAEADLTNYVASFIRFARSFFCISEEPPTIGMPDIPFPLSDRLNGCDIDLRKSAPDPKPTFTVALEHVRS